MKESIRIGKYGFFEQDTRLVINGEITRTVFDAKGTVLKTGHYKSVIFYNYFTPNLRELLQ